MEKRYFAITMAGAHHQITEETANRILSANNQDLVELDKGEIIKVSTISEVLPYDAYKEQFPDRAPADMHQPYSFGPDAVELSWDQIKELPGQGFDGLLEHAASEPDRAKKRLQAFLRGLNKAKEKVGAGGTPTPNIDQFIKLTEAKL
jgi:hypothetical protein